MADDRHYVPGDFFRVCDRTGFKVRAGSTNKEWTGRIVRNESWEERQPQDFVRGVTDDQTVPEARPRQIDVFIGPLATTLTANAAAGATVLAVASSARMFMNDKIEIIMSGNGDTFLTTIASVNSAVSITINDKLPHPASSGAVITDITAVTLPFIG